MKDFPPIIQERNPEVLAKLVADSVKESGFSLDAETTEVSAEVPLQVRSKRTASDAGSEASGARTKKSRKDKSEASATDNSFAPIPKRKRGKGESSIIKDAASEADAMDWDAEVEEESAKKKQSSNTQNECPMFVMTPAMARMTKEYADTMIAEKKQKKADYLAAREEKLQSLGLENCDEYFVQKIAEVRQIAGSVEQQYVVEAQEMLELVPEASEADGSVAALESASVAEVSEASAKVIQTSSLPFIIPTHISPSNDSDLDDIPIGQRMRKLHKPSPQPQQTTPQLPLQAKQSSVVAECTEDPEDPPTSDLPQCDSPSNLFSLERHWGGEITKTPQKAIKSVPKQIDLVNQQQQQTPQTTPKQTSISTPTQSQNTPQKAIPEPVVETVVPESVQVTESEQTVAITVSEPIQTPTQPTSTAITNDQLSSSSSTIQTQQQPPPNMLKSEFLEAELLAINTEVQRLVQLRRSPTLKIAYQEQWETLQTRASELLSVVSQKCIKVHNAASMHFVSNVHLVEDQNPLYLANIPYFSESEYLTREARLFKLLREKIVKQQEEAKAKEVYFLQKQLELEATVKMQKDLIDQLMNKQA